MTIFVPLDADAEFPSFPSFLEPSSDPEAHCESVLNAILKAKRIVVLCGAGISVDAGIPDFRSSEGLFASLKKENSNMNLKDGKDLFDACVFNSTDMTNMFCQMIAKLASTAHAANPTPFHKLLAALDKSGKLLRVYTQNIDTIETKAGLSFGVPGKSQPKQRSKAISTSFGPTTPTRASSSRLTPEAEIPRCIPLHGSLQTLHCSACTYEVRLQPYLDQLEQGMPQCPRCTDLEEERSRVGKRSRGIGKLRPSVVLYNETHKDGEGVGEVVSRDLMGTSKGKGRGGADLLLVVGTSLKVPGTKTMVRQFSKAVKSRWTTCTGLQTPTSTPRKSELWEEEGAINSIYLNLDFPVPTREWEGVFDVWMQGDAQTFAGLLQDALDKQNASKEAAAERKRKREEEAESADARPFKRGKANMPLTPVSPKKSLQSKTRQTPITGSFATNTRSASLAGTKAVLLQPVLMVSSSERSQPSCGTIRIPARSPKFHVAPTQLHNSLFGSALASNSMVPSLTALSPRKRTVRLLLPENRPPRGGRKAAAIDRKTQVIDMLFDLSDLSDLDEEEPEAGLKVEEPEHNSDAESGLTELSSDIEEEEDDELPVWFSPTSNYTIAIRS